MVSSVNAKVGMFLGRQLFDDDVGVQSCLDSHRHGVLRHGWFRVVGQLHILDSFVHEGQTFLNPLFQVAEFFVEGVSVIGVRPHGASDDLPCLLVAVGSSPDAECHGERVNGVHDVGVTVVSLTILFPSCLQC